MIDETRLDWTPILLIAPLLATYQGHLVTALPRVERFYLARHPQGVVMALWHTPPEERREPSIQLVGWRPNRRQPFAFPSRFHTAWPGAAALLPAGGWLLPYDEGLYQLYHQAMQRLEQSLRALEQTPPSAPDLQAVWRTILT